MTTKDIVEERREEALKKINKIICIIEPVECDDYGDEYWKWHVDFMLAINGDKRKIGDDYFHEEPDKMKLYNYLLESIKDGSMGDTIADILTQERR